MAIVLAAPSSTTAPVHVNVGGTSYTTSLETLTRFPNSKLAKYFDGSLPITLDPTKNQYFFDRDGKTFRHVLNFLRNSKLILPDNFGELKLLLEEAVYFEIEDLCRDIQQFMENEIKKSEEIEVKTFNKEHDGNSSSTETSDVDENSSQSTEKNKKKKRKNKRRSKLMGKQDQKTTSEADQGNDGSMERSRPNYIDNNETTRSIEEKNNRGQNQQNLYVNEKGTEENNMPTTNVSTLNNRELACIITNPIGGVQELWCSEEHFNIEGLITMESSQFVKVQKCSTDNGFLSADCFGFYSVTKCTHCPELCDDETGVDNMPICYSCRKNYESTSLMEIDDENKKNRIAFPRVSRFLFNNNYRLVTSLLVGDCIHSYFVK